MPKTTTTEGMPQYRSHKLVHALEIADCRRLITDEGDWFLQFVDPNIPSQNIKNELVVRYKPVAGDFYVVYDNGPGKEPYASFSPRKNFLEGYALVEDERTEFAEVVEPGDEVMLMDIGLHMPMLVTSISDARTGQGDLEQYAFLMWFDANLRLVRDSVPARLLKVTKKHA